MGYGRFDEKKISEFVSMFDTEYIEVFALTCNVLPSESQLPQLPYVIQVNLADTS